MAISKSQIDKLGERLRSGQIADSDLRLLDEFRRSFREPNDLVVRSIRDALILQPTGRPAKSTSSIVQKLQRERTRLSRMQDIAGCRVLVENRLEQDTVAVAIHRLFDRVDLVDRRVTPSHGYRAIHLIAHAAGKLVEIQLRTQEQHLWAELSERIADIDPSVKYGGGPKKVREFLDLLSERLAQDETAEREALDLQHEVTRFREEVERLGQNAHEAGISLQDVRDSERRIENLKSVASTRKHQLRDLLKDLTTSARIIKRS